MRIKIQYIICFAFIIAVSSCNNETDNSVQLQNAVELSANVSDGNTRAIDTTWEDGDMVGLTMYDYGTNDLNLPTTYNRKYITAASRLGYFKAVSLAETLYYPFSKDDKVSLLAYYPYQASITYPTVAIDINDQSDLTQLDYMVGFSGPYDRENTNVSMRFKRKMAMLRFKFELISDEEIARLDGATITITGLPTKGEIVLSASDEISTSNMDKIQDITLNIDKTKKKAEAVIFPHIAAAGIKFTIKLKDGFIQAFDMPNNHGVREGYRRTYSFSNLNELVMTSDGLEPWTYKGEYETTWE